MRPIIRIGRRPRTATGPCFAADAAASGRPPGVDATTAGRDAVRWLSASPAARTAKVPSTGARAAVPGKGPFGLIQNSDPMVTTSPPHPRAAAAGRGRRHDVGAAERDQTACSELPCPGRKREERPRLVGVGQPQRQHQRGDGHDPEQSGRVHPGRRSILPSGHPAGTLMPVLSPPYHRAGDK